MLEQREGGCHCGRIRFRAEVDLDLLSQCSCFGGGISYAMSITRIVLSSPDKCRLQHSGEGYPATTRSADRLPNSQAERVRKDGHHRQDRDRHRRRSRYWPRCPLTGHPQQYRELAGWGGTGPFGP
jgi:hypothetical protein